MRERKRERERERERASEGETEGGKRMEDVVDETQADIGHVTPPKERTRRPARPDSAPRAAHGRAPSSGRPKPSVRASDSY